MRIDHFRTKGEAAEMFVRKRREKERRGYRATHAPADAMRCGILARAATGSQAQMAVRFISAFGIALSIAKKGRPFLPSNLTLNSTTGVNPSAACRGKSRIPDGNRAHLRVSVQQPVPLHTRGAQREGV